MVNTPSVAYLTILASNYLPKALALADSLRQHEGAELHVLLIDVPTRPIVPGSELPGVGILGTDFLGLAESEVLKGSPRSTTSSRSRRRSSRCC